MTCPGLGTTNKSETHLKLRLTHVLCFENKQIQGWCRQLHVNLWDVSFCFNNCQVQHQTIPRFAEVVYFCVLYGSVKKMGTIALCSIKWLVCTTETELVYCVVPAEFLHIIQVRCLLEIGPHWTYFIKFYILSIYRKSAEKIQVLFKFEKNNT